MWSLRAAFSFMCCFRAETPCSVGRLRLQPTWISAVLHDGGEKHWLLCPRAVLPRAVSIVSSAVCSRFFASTEPATVYLVAKSEQPAESGFHRLGLIAPGLVLGNCLQKNNLIWKDIIDSAATFRRSSAEAGRHLVLVWYPKTACSIVFSRCVFLLCYQGRIGVYEYTLV